MDEWLDGWMVATPNGNYFYGLLRNGGNCSYV